MASIPDGCGRVVLNSQCNLTLVLLGKAECGFIFEQMVKIRSISAKYITRMYNAKIKVSIG